MRKLKILVITAAAAMLAACSGGSDDTLTGGGNPTGPGEEPAAEISTLTLLTSSPQMPSDGSANATISALVRDSNNNVMEGVSVIFSADSGSLAVSQPTTTDASGVLTATLSTAGDPTARAITVSALAGDEQASVVVDVAGVAVTIDGPKSLSNGGQGSYTVRVVDNPVNGDPVAGVDVEVSSSGGNTLSATSLTTDTKGEAVFTVTAASSGADSLTAETLGVSSAPFALTVSADSFNFTTPDPAADLLEIDLGVEQEVAVLWQQGAGQAVSFASSRGSFTDCAGAAVPNNTVVASGTGVASICVVSTNAGPAVITATNDSEASIQANVEFVAVTATTLDLQASPFTIGTNSQSAITAVVRDASGNLVKNQIVTFVLDDVTGGSLSSAQSTTNSQGRAQTGYTSSSTTSSVDGVEITATVQGFPAVTGMVNLTVAQQESFISLGTGNEISEPNTAQYRKEWVVQVTDTQGNGVPNADVTFSVLSTRYWDGSRTWNGTSWATTALPAPGCTDEDTLTLDPVNNRNGILDVGEDLNGNGTLEAGNIASAAPQGGSGSSLTMDGNGFGIIDVYWPQEYAYYLEVVLEVRTSVQGSESSGTTTFVLDGLASDFSEEKTAPPGIVSPFGIDGNCGTPPPS